MAFVCSRSFYMLSSWRWGERALCARKKFNFEIYARILIILLFASFYNFPRGDKIFSTSHSLIKTPFDVKAFLFLMIKICCYYFFCVCLRDFDSCIMFRLRFLLLNVRKKIICCYSFEDTKLSSLIWIYRRISDRFRGTWGEGKFS